MAYKNDKEGKKVVVVDEYSVCVHECPKCGMTFAVTAILLEDREDDGKGHWSAIPQTPNYCYMCGSLMKEEGA